MAERKLRTTYREDMALFPNRVNKFWIAVLLLILVVFPFLNRADGALGLPVLSDNRVWLTIAVTVLIAATASLGLNLLSGFAGQISLGHAFFIGVGVFVGAMVTADPNAATLSGVTFWGFDLPWWVAVIAGGVVAAVIGVIVGPTAVRLRGLYLSLVTLALVFFGEFLFTAPALEKVTGAVRGRRSEPVSLVVPGSEEPLFGLIKESEQLYYAALLLAIFAYVVGKNIARSRVGRAFQATRDRDIAAEVIGVNVTWAKLTAFGLSSFFAGAAGVLFGVFLGNPLGASFGGAPGLLLSIEYIAMIVIGGIGTVLGAALGAAFVVGLPELVNYMTNQGWLPFVSDIGGGGLDGPLLSAILFGRFIVIFLVFEPYGLYGIWLRARNYWKGWPFSY